MHETEPDLTLEIGRRTAPGLTSTAPAGAYLVHIFPPGPNLGARYPLGEGPQVLGRDHTCDISVDDPSVSRRHARFQPENDGFAVTDLGSTNGTAVNKVPITKCKLRDGNEVQFGNCIYRFLASGNVEAQYHEEIYRLSVSDPLTHIPNRRFFQQFLERELFRSVRYQIPLALVLFDIDHFKEVNDLRGHLAGDFALQELAACVKEILRKESLFARFGGEEFAVVLPQATMEEGIFVAERIRTLVEQHVFVFEGQSFLLTISLGVSGTSGQAVLTPEEFIHQADASLYLAKKYGRNRVVSVGTALVAEPHF
jgi:diguanylate cyclase (GGDEF)-like protein